MAAVVSSAMLFVGVAPATAGETAAARSAVVQTTKTTTPGAPLVCLPNNVYSISPGGTIRHIVNPDDSSPEEVVDLGDYASANGLAIGAGGTVVYAYERSGGTSQNISSIIRYTPATGQVEQIPNTALNTGNNRSMVTGAVNLDNGRYLFGGYDGEGDDLLFRLYEFNPADSQISTLGYFDTGLHADATANGDMAFDSAGNLYIVRSGSTINVFTVTAETLMAASGGELAFSATNAMTLSGLSDVNGIAFDGDGSVYLGNGSTVKRYDPSDWSELSTATTQTSSTDLASCNSPANLTVVKDVAGRVDTDDQFTLRVARDGEEIATATTTGSATGVQTEQIGPIPVIAGDEYEISESMAAGDGADYASSWTCDDGQTVTEGTSGTVEIPDVSGASVLCTFTNAPLVTAVSVDKTELDAAGENPTAGAGWTVGAALDGTTGGTAATDPAAATQQTADDGTASWDVVYSATGTTTDITVSETQQDGWEFVRGSCTVTPLGGNPAEVSIPDAAGVTLQDVGPGATVDCSFVNKVIAPGSLTIVKDYDGSAGIRADATFTGTYDCGPDGPDGTWRIEGEGTTVVTDLPVGATCVVAEDTAALTATPADYLVDASFAWDTVGEVTQPGAVVSGETVKATVRNTTERVYGAIAVTKKLIGTPDGFTGDFSGAWSCVYGEDAPLAGTWSVDTSGAATLTGPYDAIPLTSECAVTEDAPSDTMFADPSYTWASAKISPAEDEVDTAGEAVTFTVKNTAQQSTLTLAKLIRNTHGGTVTDPAAWDQKLQAQRGEDTPILFDHDETIAVPHGEYVIDEIDQISGYELTDVTCTADGSPVELDGDAVAVAEGADVVCVLTNSDVAPKLTLVKKVDNRDGTGSRVSAEWSLTASGDRAQDWNPQTQSTTDPLVAATATQPLLGGSSYLLEENGPSGYTAGVWSCDSGIEVVGGQITLSVGDDVTCEITNTAVPAEGTVGKSLVTGSPVQNADGTWTIVYEVSVTNESTTSTFFYDLTDELRFGAGITPTAASWTGPGGGGDFALPEGTATLATDASIAPAAEAADRTHVYTVTVTASIADGTQDGETWQCQEGDEPGAGGFLNTATMSVGDEDTTVHACGEPGFPVITKTGAAPQYDADASVGVSYTVTIANPDAVDLEVVLSDDLPGVPAGWSLAGGEWTIAAVEGAPAPATASAAPGEVVIWQGTLPVDAMYTYTVEGTLTPTVEADPIGVCGTSEGGLVNTATVTSGEVVEDAEGCVSVTLPPVEVVKADGDAEQLADGTWQIDYVVTVLNASAQPTVYTLTDTPDLGTGFSLLSGEWIGDAPQPNTPIAGADIEPVAHVYTYRIVAEFDPQTAEPQLTCEPGDGGAFHNIATVVFPGGSDSDDGCAEPASPTVTKTALPAMQNAETGAWTLGYEVEVRNDSDVTVAYDLTDVPDALPTGVSGGAWEAAGPVVTGGGEGVLDEAWNGVEKTEMASGMLPAGAVHVYTVTRTVAVAVDVDDETLACADPTEGTGFWNTATVTNGIGEDTDTACTHIDRPEVTIEKTVADTVDLGDDRWEITYEVVVRNADDELTAVYDLTDTLRFGEDITVTAAEWSGATEGGFTAPWSATLAEGRALAGGGADTYTVTVLATVDIATASAASLACVSGDDPAAGGFLNTATVTAAGVAQSAHDCSRPSGELPVTGGQIALPAILFGLLALVGGAALTVAGRRRRTGARL
ncbi:DUF5979 domain-containing protein [Microbacterium sp. SSW1-59]|uniref:DUF5979 domain-containing protein n=1 Tax=Microbacterium xanthum TaxID=3079794 RepID=UPI002AD4964F|nr:DUF5979 domain-containing protein [Microbacterium sp. SSW1-59]MDZ8201117.1 DUF5979 domain-containing protein [Microbacterium sp. SSW1-59]